MIWVIVLTNVVIEAAALFLVGWIHSFVSEEILVLLYPDLLGTPAKDMYDKLNGKVTRFTIN